MSQKSIYYYNIKPYYDERDNDPSNEDYIDDCLDNYQKSDKSYNEIDNLFLGVRDVLEIIPSNDVKTKLVLKRMMDVIKTEEEKNMFYEMLMSYEYRIFKLLLENNLIEMSVNILDNMSCRSSISKEIFTLVFPKYMNPNDIFLSTQFDKFVRLTNYDEFQYLSEHGLNINDSRIINELINNDRAKIDYASKIILITYNNHKYLFLRDENMQFISQTFPSITVKSRMFDQLAPVLNEYMNIECVSCISRRYLRIY